MTSRVDAEKKRAQALELHLAGISYENIARQLGYRGRQGAHEAVKAELGKYQEQTSDDGDLTELARLDAMRSGLWTKARRGDVAAINAIMKIDERKDQIRLRAVMKANSNDAPVVPVEPEDEVAQAREARERKARQAADRA